MQFLIPATAVYSSFAVVRPYVCPEHRKLEIRSRRIGHLLLLIAIAAILGPFLIFFNLPDAYSAFAYTPIAGAPLGLLWFYYRVFRPRILFARQIDQNHAWLREVHPGIVEQLPPLPGHEEEPEVGT